MKLNKISKAFFINLERRKDRLDHINKNLPFNAERFDAIDANNIELNEEIEKLFKKCLKNLTKAEIACSLSHYKLWKQLTLDNEADNYLILEDDVVFKKGFTNFWNKVFSKHIPEDYNLLYLGGCQPWNKPQYHKVLKPHNQYFYNVKKNNFFNKEDHYFHMNAQSYVISKQGASLICQYVDQLGFDLEKSQAQDIFMVKFFNKNKIFEAPDSIFHLYPNMSYQLHEENDNTEIDKKSDLRHASEKFNDLEKISVIIPTIWKANNYLRRSLQDLDRENLVEEIILINNNKEETPNWIKNIKKVKLIDPGERLYFNKSVNLGVDLCKNDICCVLNDDVIIINRNIFKYISKEFNHKLGAIFISKDSINAYGNDLPIKLKKIHKLTHGNGMLFFVRKSSFVKIPEKLVHHFGDRFTASINNLQKKQNYTIQGFKIRTKESASQKYAKGVISKDWRIHKEVFNNLNQFLPQEEKTPHFPNSDNSFPALQEISSKQIPKKIHLSWKNKNVLDSNYSLIKKGVKNLELLNPEWDIEVYDDEDINKLLRDTIGKSNWDLIKDRKITEKTDLWRLIKTYKEGGLYIDIDRYIDTPLSEVINSKTSLVLPTYLDGDFSQDFILSCAKSPILGKAISNNLHYRRQGKSLFFLAVQSYLSSVSEFVINKKLTRGGNKKEFDIFRSKVNDCEFIETYRETGPENHILFRNINKDFNKSIFEKEKCDFYDFYEVKHWNIETEERFKNTNSEETLDIIWQVNPNSISECYETDWIRELFNDIKTNEIIDCNYNVLKDNSLIIYNDIYDKKEKNKHTENLYKYLEKARHKKNVSIMHLGDEFIRARTDHYKNFKVVIRTTFNKNLSHLNNLLQIPLGYKQGFHD
jgi:GR25 family glycosyltransferase involved in LPS biosynthesis